MTDGTNARSFPRRHRFHRRTPASRLLGAAVVGLWAIASAASPAAAEELWLVRSGQTIIHFNVGLLSDLGIELEITGAATAHIEGLPIEEPYWSFPILPGSDLRFRAEHGVVLPEGGTAGAMRLGGAIVLRDRATGRETRFDDLEIARLPAVTTALPGARGAEPLHLRSAGSGLVLCELKSSMFDFRRRPGLEIHYMNAYLTGSWALAIGRPDLAGWAVGLGEVRALGERLSATPPAGPSYEPRFAGGVLDVSLGELYGIQQVAHSGTYPAGATAVAMATTSCNVGTVDVPWLAAMEEKHPVIHMALYRQLDGRFEQIGVSWLKHGFYALSNSDCTPCQNPSDGSFLGVGCSDTYDVLNNSNRSDLGPRSEVNAFAGTWTCLGSHFAGGQPDCVRRHGSIGHGPLDHRLAVADTDLANPGATYYYEANYIVEGDQALANNWGHRRCAMSWSGSAWSFSTPGGNPLIEGPALGAWGAASTAIDVAAGDGQVLLAAQATDLGGGTWHYEYALLNLNSDRQIRSFSLPVVGVPNIANIGFHDNDGEAANDWQVSVGGDSINWQTETFAQNPDAHALVFGYLYNFRFDADAPPGATNATLGLFKPGPGTDAIAGSSGPTNSVTAVGDAVIEAARVLEIRPNPFNRSATIRYQAPSGSVDLSIYDAAGRRIRRLVERADDSGVRSVVWDGAADDGVRVRAGVYYARLRAGLVVAARSVVIVD